MTGSPDTTAGPDDRLRAAALALLRCSGYRPLARLNCEVRDGRAVLTGVVPSFYLKQLAQELLLRLEELRGVLNLLEVRPGGQAVEARAIRVYYGGRSVP